MRLRSQTRTTITFRKPRRARGRRRLSARSSRLPSVPLPAQVPSEEAPISKSSKSASLQLYSSAEEASAAELRRLLSAGMSRPLSKTMTARPSSTLRPVRHAVNIIVRGRSVCDGLAAVCLCRTVARRLQGVQGKCGRRDERAKRARAPRKSMLRCVLCRLGAAALAPSFRPSRAEVRILYLPVFLCRLALICLPLRCFSFGAGNPPAETCPPPVQPCEGPVPPPANLPSWPTSRSEMQSVDWMSSTPPGGHPGTPDSSVPFLSVGAVESS